MSDRLLHQQEEDLSAGQSFGINLLVGILAAITVCPLTTLLATLFTQSQASQRAGTRPGSARSLILPAEVESRDPSARQKRTQGGILRLPSGLSREVTSDSINVSAHFQAW